MVKSIFHRTLSLGFAAVLTVAMLSSVGLLFQAELPAQQWAQKTAPRA
jgi:hypothetical protein